MAHALGSARVSPNVLWSPHNDEHFIVATSSIRLFRASTLSAPLTVLTNRHFSYGHRRALPPQHAQPSITSSTISSAMSTIRSSGSLLDGINGDGTTATATTAAMMGDARNAFAFTSTDRSSALNGNNNGVGINITSIDNDNKGPELAIDDCNNTFILHHGIITNSNITL
jgi:hypothetical protein